jgi:hypothetical protein
MELMKDARTELELTERCPQCGLTFVSGFIHGRLRSVSRGCPFCGAELPRRGKKRTRRETRDAPSLPPLISR